MNYMPQILYTDYSLVTYSGSHPVQSNGSLTNLKSGWSDEYWVSDSLVESQSLAMDFGIISGSKARNFLLIDGHNLDTCQSDGTIYLQASNNADFDSGTEDVVAIQIDLDAMTTPKPDIIFQSFTPVAKRYWRVAYYGTKQEEPRIANIIVDKSVDFQFQEKWGYKKENQLFITNENTTLDGSINNSKSQDGRLMYELDFPLQNNTFKSTLKEFLKVCRGSWQSFYFYDSSHSWIRQMLLQEDYYPVVVKKYGLNQIATLKMQSVETSTRWHDPDAFSTETGLSDDRILIDY